MINAAFNVAAIAGARRARDSQNETIQFRHYTPETKPDVRGYIYIESNKDISVEPNMSLRGAEIRFRSSAEVNKLIDKLIRLRDDMYKKEAAVTHDFKLGDYVYARDWCYGQIVDIDGDFIWVEFDTGSGGGTCTFEAHEVRHCED